MSVSKKTKAKRAKRARRNKPGDRTYRSDPTSLTSIDGILKRVYRADMYGISAWIPRPGEGETFYGIDRGIVASPFLGWLKPKLVHRLGRLGQAFARTFANPGCRHADCKNDPEMALACVEEKRMLRARNN